MSGLPIRVSCASAGDTESLYRWLQNEPDVRAGGRLSRAPSDDPQDQGVLVEVLSLVLGSGLSAGQLALAIAQWRASRASRPVVTVTHTAADGSTTRIESSDPESFSAALRALDE
jgi:hypothetical protein